MKSKNWRKLEYPGHIPKHEVFIYLVKICTFPSGIESKVMLTQIVAEDCGYPLPYETNLYNPMLNTC